MRVLVVGGTSSLAKVLIPALKEIGEVLTAGRKGCDLTIDLAETGERFSLPLGIDVVVHTAAHFGGNTPEEVLEAENVNVLGTLRLCEASLQSGVKHFILISSIYAMLEQTSDYYSIYSVTKRHAEEASLFLCSRNDLPLTILRPAQLYGNTDDFGKHQPFLYAIAGKAQRGEDIFLNGRNDALRNFLHVDDLVQIILRVIERNVTGVYSCLFPENTSISKISRSAISAFDSVAKIIFLADKEDIKSNVFPIEDTLYQKIKFFPTVDIESGMKLIAKNRIRS